MAYTRANGTAAGSLAVGNRTGLICRSAAVATLRSTYISLCSVISHCRIGTRVFGVVVIRYGDSSPQREIITAKLLSPRREAQPRDSRHRRHGDSRVPRTRAIKGRRSFSTARTFGPIARDREPNAFEKSRVAGNTGHARTHHNCTREWHGRRGFSVLG